MLGVDSMSKVTRISMSLPKKLLNEFDEVLRDRGYRSRSKAIRDALKGYIVRYQWMKGMEGELTGTLSIIYDHNSGVIDEISDIQHHYKGYIDAVMRVPLAGGHTLEVLVVRGDINKIQELSEKIMRLKGVEHVRLTSVSSEGSESDTEK